MPKPYTLDALIAKWSNRRFTTWITTEQFKKHCGHWYVLVKCDCGHELYVNVSSLSMHTHCTCELLKKVRAKQENQNKRLDLEKIWPDVVKAGQKVMRKYKNGMAKV